ncbi:hypothetical protein ElyMa_003833300 [Elysia marginata]|uniref:WAP domain-containing protein n=1 Tax=Elysia marginata TaxID=1093978 RepID=A0AAV4FG34_9GAST|nr:hypothetical protein ElyMa_003833300 [Elysia marginata]
MGVLLEGRIIAAFCSLVLISLLVPQADTLILLETKCPDAESSPENEFGVCANDCTTNSGCDSRSWCCPNSCGGRQCTEVKAYCLEGDILYSHHDLMPFHSDDPNMCGVCWCQNGKSQCHSHPCDGPLP